MSRLTGQSKPFFAKDSGSAPEESRKKMLDNFMAPETLLLTIGAQVMLIKNVDETLVNGSMGIVQRFVDPGKYATEVNDPDFMTGGAAGGVAKKPTGANTEAMPLVEFNTPGGGKRPILVLPEVWKVELPSGEVQASRQQVSAICLTAVSFLGC
jgi:ATP-dependent DNA helicase PIF1